MTSGKTLSLDDPIRSSKDDLLGRADIARDFARSIRELDPSRGIVVGVLGPWGYGKSSFINLMREEFASKPELPVVEFNPWLYSGSQQLTDIFFREIAAELRIKYSGKLDAVAEDLNDYGDILSILALVPGFGAWWDRSLKAAISTTGLLLKKRKKGSGALREKLTDALRRLERPIVVAIDDIDRLSAHEIRDIFKLVRLAARFPNVIYLLAFDRKRVEEALTDGGIQGRDYLEKIVQLPFDLPAIPGKLLRSQLLQRLDGIIEGIEDIRFSEQAWQDVYFEIIEPLIRSPRDVARFALSARPTIRTLGAEVETVDLMALEAMRVFRPEIFEEIRELRLTLTEPSRPYESVDRSRQRQQIERLLEIASDDAELVQSLIRRLFPAARRYIDNLHFGSDVLARWKREHRVAHIFYLELYFERVASADLLAFRLAERAYERFSDSQALGEFLDSVPREQLEDVIAGLEAYEDDYARECVVPASVALMNRIHHIPKRPPRGLLDIPRPEIVVTRVVLRLLRRIDREAEREHAVRDILQRLRSFSSQLQLITMVGYDEGAGHRLVSEDLAAELRRDLVSRARASVSPVLGEEWDLARVYWWVAEDLGDEYVPLVLSEPEEIRSLLSSGQTFRQSQSSESRRITAEELLWWDGVVRVAGGEQRLVAAIARLRAADGDTPLVEIAERYAAGWRPSRTPYGEEGES